jgi:hypothetical protein
MYINEEIAYKKIISRNKVTELKNLSKYLYKVKGKWENEVTKNGAMSGGNERGL